MWLSSKGFKTLLAEPESQSIIFSLVNFIVLIYVLFFLLTWPYTLFYLIAHVAVFTVVIRRLSAGRLYTPKKNLKNQTIVITGAATGIGRVTAVELAKLEALVIVGIRGQERAERVAQELSNESHGNVIGHHLDLSDLSSINAFAKKIDKVDILINNAGVSKRKKELTRDGLECTFGTNHIGHFYLTQLLLPLLIQSNGRIINVSSIMHVTVAYCRSKLANILYAAELQRRYGDRGAMTTMYCALLDEAQPGKYHSNCQVAQPTPVANNSKKAQELWELSERILNEKTKYL
ncbi:unnamed protein product [Rotaria sp. Silwood1]|nr:unnamed protein product [Rotaria sp. Silwood1]